MASRVVKRPGAGQAVTHLLAPVLLGGAQGAAVVLRGKLSGSGSGIHHPGLPNRSSAEGEYPAQQTSKLMESVSARPRDDGGAEFGLIDGPPYVVALHFSDPSSGGRPVMDDAKYDRDVWRGIYGGIRQAAAKVGP